MMTMIAHAKVVEQVSGTSRSILGGETCAERMAQKTRNARAMTKMKTRACTPHQDLVNPLSTRAGESSAHVRDRDLRRARAKEAAERGVDDMDQDLGSTVKTGTSVGSTLVEMKTLAHARDQELRGASEKEAVKACVNARDQDLRSAGMPA